MSVPPEASGVHRAAHVLPCTKGSCFQPIALREEWGHLLEPQGLPVGLPGLHIENRNCLGLHIKYPLLLMFIKKKKKG